MSFFPLNPRPIHATTMSYQQYPRNASQGSSLLTTSTAAHALSPHLLLCGRLRGRAMVGCVRQERGAGGAPCGPATLQLCDLERNTYSLNGSLSVHDVGHLIEPTSPRSLGQKTVSQGPQQARSRWVLSLAHSGEADCCVVSGPWKDHRKELRWHLAHSWWRTEALRPKAHKTLNARSPCERAWSMILAPLGGPEGTTARAVTSTAAF